MTQMDMTDITQVRAAAKRLRTLFDCASDGVHILDEDGNVVDYAKIEAGKLDLEAVDIEIASVLEHSTTLFALAAEEKGIELIFEVDPELPPVLVGDPLRFKQIINNLLGNAVKFTEQGHVRLSLRVLQRQGDRVGLQVAVGDTGIGMTPAQLERLFTAFGQADTSW